MRKKQVVVIGASDAVDFCDEAYSIGAYIAQQGYVLITGGRGGIMEAASQGAFEHQGTVIGILPGADDSEANPYCTIVLPTGIGFARNIVNILAADIVIAIGGKAGTLSELAYAWQYGKPVICCTFAEGWSQKLPATGIDDRPGSTIYSAETVEDVFRCLKNHFL
ncbi:MAG: TIGR00725 family protein [bacterium]|nr:TIGR00725 family protein [bacterium]